ncbi:hypothetical protein BH11PSE2_BH11PSE2_00920 [soil metagenome]
MRILILASGGGGSLRFLYRALPLIGAASRVVGVIADRDCGAVASARTLGLPTVVVAYERSAPAALREAIVRLAPDIVVTNFHKLIDAETLKLARFINLHYSLLPAFAGLFPLQVVRAARQAGAGFIGATCHEVDESVDGGPILGQAMFPADWNHDDSEILDLTFRSAGLVLLSCLQAIEDQPAVSSEITICGQTVSINPGLSADHDLFDETFWRAVKAGNLPA